METVAQGLCARMRAAPVGGAGTFPCCHRSVWPRGLPAPATITAGETVRLRGTMVLNRVALGMTYARDKIHEAVEVRFDVNANR
jgi:hypothetical protein